MLRAKMRETVSSLDPVERAEASKKIRHLLQSLPAWQKAKVVYSFAPLVSEPDWLGGDWPDGHTIVLPRIEKDEMRFFTALPHEMKPGAFGILEPVSKDPAPPPDLAIIPGLAFDRRGCRLGRGRGFYDRFLEQIPHVSIIGLCFARQLVGRVPTEPHDRRVNIVITESEIIAP